MDRRTMLGGALLATASTACGQTMSGRDALNVRAFGARGDGIADDTPAIQRAIDAAARSAHRTVILDPGTYLVRHRPSEDGDGVSALTLRSGVTIMGSDRNRCVIRLADAQHGPGTYARMIASNGAIERVALRSLGIDGNRKGQGRFSNDFSGAAILLGWKARCTDVVLEDLAVRDTVGQGIMLLGSIGNPARNLRVASTLVERTAFIGIQCSQFDGIEIADNIVNDCHDNAIDVYGNDDLGKSTEATSHRASIVGNRIRGCSIGIFLETVADCIARGNIIDSCRVAGVRVNRINGEPRNLTIENNRVTDTPIGIAMGGDTGGVVIHGNDIRGFTTAAIEFSYNVSRVTATANVFLPARRDTAIVLGRPTVLGSAPEEQLAHIQITGNRVPRDHPSNRLFVSKYRRTVDVDIGRFAGN